MEQKKQKEKVDGQEIGLFVMGGLLGLLGLGITILALVALIGLN